MQYPNTIVDYTKPSSHSGKIIKTPFNKLSIPEGISMYKNTHPTNKQTEGEEPPKHIDTVNPPRHPLNKYSLPEDFRFEFEEKKEGGKFIKSRRNNKRSRKYRKSRRSRRGRKSRRSRRR